MMDMDAPGQAKRYREMARAIRAIIPSLTYSEARGELDVLALRYERLAQSLDTVPSLLQLGGDSNDESAS
jgi:hypothetical protein